MKLHADARIPFPREVVFAVFRDELDKLVPFLPSVRSIAITAREERGGVVDNVIEWRVGANIPGPLRTVISESMLSWTDYATWDAATLTCDWHTETNAFAEAVRCGAHDRFLEDGPGKTLLEIRGVLEVDTPTAPLWRAGYNLWFTKAVPALGAVLSDKDAYRYLPQSVAYLPPAPVLRSMLRAAGFSAVGIRPLAGGLSQMVVATRTGAP